MQVHRLLARQFFHPVLRRPVTQRAGGRTPLLFYSQVAWDTVWQRPQEEALGLSRYRPVVFLSPVQLHEWTARLSDRWQFARRLEGGRLTVLSPLIFSGEYRSPIVRATNRRLITRLARRICGDARPILMTNTPFCEYLVDALEPRAVVWDLIDDFCGFEWSPPESREQERRLIDRTDLALAGTGFLQERYVDRLPGLQFLPSGVRFEALTTPVEEPDDLRGLPHPRLLYVGTINDRLNGDLFLAAAKAAGAGCVVAVGPRHATFQAPPLPSNVHFLGLKPHEALAGYYQHCDLGLMPFGDSPAARAINPIKTLEYLACGLPVISTPVPDVIRYYPGVVRVEEPGAWGGALREMLAEDSAERRAARIDFARHRSWKSLVRDVEARLRKLEADKR